MKYKFQHVKTCIYTAYKIQHQRWPNHYTNVLYKTDAGRYFFSLKDGENSKCLSFPHGLTRRSYSTCQPILMRNCLYHVSRFRFPLSSRRTGQQPRCRLWRSAQPHGEPAARLLGSVDLRSCLLFACCSVRWCYWIGLLSTRFATLSVISMRWAD